MSVQIAIDPKITLTILYDEKWSFALYFYFLTWNNKKYISYEYKLSLLLIIYSEDFITTFWIEDILLIHNFMCNSCVCEYFSMQAKINLEKLFVIVEIISRLTPKTFYIVISIYCCLL